MSASSERYFHPPLPPEPKPAGHFKLEAVVICAGYSDFLRETLPNNKSMFDRIVVVTTPDDQATQKLCEFYHVECIRVPEMVPQPGQFCKGIGINRGLDRLAKDGWVLHLDADMWLPPQTRNILQKIALDPKAIYGVDRFIVPSYDEWKNFLAGPRLQHECESWTHPTAFKIGTRVMTEAGYIAIGFFQLWNPIASGVFRYLEGHTNAGREDGLFAQLWPRSRRHMLPEIIGYHLESEIAPMGANWNGRKTKFFGPQPVGKKNALQKLLHKLLGRCC